MSVKQSELYGFLIAAVALDLVGKDAYLLDKLRLLGKRLLILGSDRLEESVNLLGAVSTLAHGGEFCIDYLFGFKHLQHLSSLNSSFI